MSVDMVSIIGEAESAVARVGGRRHAILAGSGTAALTLACGLANPERRRVIIPAVTCINVMNAAIYAGREPLLADVRQQDATIDPDHVEALMARDRRVGAVVAVHLYGHRADMDALSAITRRHGALLIEDAAQAVGGRNPDGRPFGTAGDVAVFSFGHTKILDAGGGGALLLDNPDWLSQGRVAAARLPERSPRLALLAQHYSRLFYTIWEVGRDDARFLALFHSFPDLFAELFVHAAEPEQARSILRLLPTLEDDLAHRRRLHQAYSEAFSEIGDVQIFETRPGFAPWRFSFRVQQASRDAVVSALRHAHFDASTWYPCLAGWAPGSHPAERANVPVAARLEREIVNLWVNRSYTLERARAVVAVIRQALSRAAGKE